MYEFYRVEKILRDLHHDNAVVSQRCSLNRYNHRGDQICKVLAGNSSFFGCSYHGWTFADGEKLVGVSLCRSAYLGKLVRRDLNQLKVRVDGCKGLIFGFLGREAETLESYLGGFQYYLDLNLCPGFKATHAYTPADGWVTKTDRKFRSQNFAGDSCSTPVARQIGFQLGSKHVTLIGTLVSTRKRMLSTVIRYPLNLIKSSALRSYKTLEDQLGVVR